MMIGTLWNSIAPFQTQLVSLALSLIGVFVVWLCRAEVRLIYGKANNSLNHVSVPNSEHSQQSTYTEIYAEKFFLQNVGRKPAKDVEFVLSNFPTDINIFQPREAEFKQVGKGNCMIKIPKIAPSELVIIDCVYINMQAAYITSVKCAEVLGKEVPFQTVRKFPKPVEYTVFVALILGIAFIAQVLITFF